MNVHLIIGQSKRIINKEINNIVKKNNYLIIDMNESNLLALMQEVSYSFFLDEKKYVVVKNLLNNISEKDELVLINYLKNPNEKVVLIFVEEKVDGRKKIPKLLKSKYDVTNVLIEYKSKPSIYDIVNEYILENGYKCEYKLAGYLVGFYGLNVDIIFNELDKVFLYYQNKEYLTVDNCKDIISTVLMQNNFKFIESVIEKNIESSLNILNDLLVYKTEPSMLVIMLAREYRIMSYIKKYYSDRMSISEMMSELKVESWQVEKYYKNSLAYTKDELLENIKKLSILDQEIKNGRIDKLSGLQLFLLESII